MKALALRGSDRTIVDRLNLLDFEGTRSAQKHSKFADPASAARPKRGWLSKPKFTRQPGGNSVAIDIPFYRTALWPRLGSYAAPRLLRLVFPAVVALASIENVLEAGSIENSCGLIADLFHHATYSTGILIRTFIASSVGRLTDTWKQG